MSNDRKTRKFQLRVWRDDDGGWTWELAASNGTPIAVSPAPLSSKRNAFNAIASLARSTLPGQVALTVNDEEVEAT